MSNISERNAEAYGSLIEKLIAGIDAGTVPRIKKNGTLNWENKVEGIEEFEYKEVPQGSGKGYFFYVGTDKAWNPRVTNPSKPQLGAVSSTTSSALMSQGILAGIARGRSKEDAIREAKEDYGAFVALLNNVLEELPGLESCIISPDDPAVQAAHEIFQHFEDLDHLAEDPSYIPDSLIPPEENQGGGAIVKYRKQRGGGGWDEIKRLAFLLCKIPAEAIRATGSAIADTLRPLSDALVTNLNNGNATRFFFTTVAAYPLYLTAMDLASPDSYVVWATTELASYLYSWVDPLTSLSFWWGLGGNLLYLGGIGLGIGAIGAITYIINKTMKEILTSTFWWSYAKLLEAGTYVAGTPAHIRATLALTLTIAFDYIRRKGPGLGAKIANAAYDSTMSVAVNIYTYAGGSASSEKVIYAKNKGYTYAIMPKKENKSATTIASSAASATTYGASSKETNKSKITSKDINDTAAKIVSGTLKIVDVANAVMSNKVSKEFYEEVVLKTVANSSSSSTNPIQRALVTGDKRVKSILSKVENARVLDLVRRRPQAAILLVSKSNKLGLQKPSGSKRGASEITSANEEARIESAAETTSANAQVTFNDILENITGSDITTLGGDQAAASALLSQITPAMAALLELTATDLDKQVNDTMAVIAHEEATEEGQLGNTALLGSSGASSTSSSTTTSSSSALVSTGQTFPTSSRSTIVMNRGKGKAVVGITSSSRTSSGPYPKPGSSSGTTLSSAVLGSSTGLFSPEELAKIQAERKNNNNNAEKNGAAAKKGKKEEGNNNNSKKGDGNNNSGSNIGGARRRTRKANKNKKRKATKRRR